MRPHPRLAETDPSSPRAWATCDRCGFVTNLYKLAFQYDWRGAKLDNTRILVCSPCYDDPQRQLGVIFIPPDPLPKLNARVEAYTADEQPVSTRYTMNGIARAARYQPYPVLRIVNGQGNVPTTPLSLLPFQAVQHGNVPSGGGSTSPPVNTSGFTFFIAVVASTSEDPPAPTDNQNNTWVLASNGVSGTANVAIYYVINPITNGSHTFTSPGTGNSGMIVAFYTGTFTGPLAVISPTAADVPSRSITVSSSNVIVFYAALNTGLVATGQTTFTNGFNTVAEIVNTGSVNGCVLASVTSTTSETLNTTMSYSGVGVVTFAYAMASFGVS